MPAQKLDRVREKLPSPARLARGLGWFSIALGVAELTMPRTVARACGLRDDAGLVRLYGCREIACGIGILCSRDPTPWLWGRVAGDIVDVSTIVAEVDAHDPQARHRSGLALANVAAVTALDVYTARHYRPDIAQPGVDVRDYSDRVGMPRPPAQMRGAAREDFEVPRDMRTPDALRPWTSQGVRLRHPG